LSGRIANPFAGLEHVNKTRKRYLPPRTAGARSRAAPAVRPASVVSVESFAVSQSLQSVALRIYSAAAFAAAFRPGDHMRLETATLAATRKPDHPSIAASIAPACLRRVHGANASPV